MARERQTVIPLLIERHHQKLLGDWLTAQGSDVSTRGKGDEAALTGQSSRFLTELKKARAATAPVSPSLSSAMCW